MDNSDKTLAPANNNAQSDDNKYKLQLMSKDKPQLMHNYSTELKDKNSKNGFVEKKKKKEKHVRNEHQPERACRAICAAYAAVFQEATGIRWTYDDRQVSIAAAVLNLGYTEAWRSLHSESNIYSFWDYQAGAWQKDNGIRIDHFLLSPACADLLEECRIDAEIRGREKPSDHVPVWVRLRA